MTDNKLNYIHIISDSTGQTAKAVAVACTSQFWTFGASFKEKVWPMVRTMKELDKVLKFIKSHPGPIVFTICDFKLRSKVRDFAQENKIPATSPISEVVLNISRYYNLPLPNSQPGEQLRVNDDYFKKIDCLQYTQEHDDGANLESISKADIIIIGVSRTSKSPISFYLAHRGYNVANIPFFHLVQFPLDIEKYQNSLVIGLTINPEVLSLIRKKRSNADFGLAGDIKEFTASNYEQNQYIGYDDVKKEVIECMRFFTKYNIPYIDVTKKAIEETATEIIQLYEEKFNIV